MTLLVYALAVIGGLTVLSVAWLWYEQWRWVRGAVVC